LKEFKEGSRYIRRLTSGICNEVYLVGLSDKEAVVRLNSQVRFLIGSHNHIPLFKARRIRVPDILAEDYSKTQIPYGYQVLSKVEGEDIGGVIETLADDQLKAIAREISNVFQKLRDVPTNGKYGVLWGDASELVDSWTQSIRHMSNVAVSRGSKTGVMDKNLLSALAWINEQYEPYFERVESTCYFGDLSSKNVMIHNGVFSGLVDLDSLAQGDYLEAIGRIKASWTELARARYTPKQLRKRKA
jgi:aminoglycoside phosphotransferase (APT) family kinase protein